MALTAANIQTQVSAATGVKSTQTALYAEILYYIQHAVDDLYALEFSWAKVQSQFTTTAPYETGTISGTLASTTVTGDGTTWDTSWVDTFMDVNDKQHRVASYGSTTSATLTAALDGTVAAATSYSIYYPWVTLDTTLATLTSVVGYPHAPLRILTLDDLDDLFMFTQTQDHATCCALTTPDSAYTSRIALYPFPTEARMYSYHGYRMAPTIADGTTELGIPTDYRGLITEMVLAYWWSIKDKNPGRAQRHEQKAGQLMRLYKPRDPKAQGPREIRGWRVRSLQRPVPYSSYELWG